LCVGSSRSVLKPSDGLNAVVCDRSVSIGGTPPGLRVMGQAPTLFRSANQKKDPRLSKGAEGLSTNAVLEATLILIMG
jgi:hypothetical protein